MVMRRLSFALLLPLLSACLGDGTLDEEVDCGASGAQLIQTHCLSCHSATLGARERGGAPLGVDFDTEDEIRQWAPGIRLETFEKETMPEERPFAQCEKDALEAYLLSLESSCQPSCEDKRCGDDGCGGSCGGCGDGEVCEDSRCVSALPSYSRHIDPIFRAKGCASSGCHGGLRPEEGLDLRDTASAYESLVGRPSTQCDGKVLVVPGDPSASYLLNKLTGQGMCHGSRMPVGGQPLAAHELDRVRIWIETGAGP